MLGRLAARTVPTADLPPLHDHLDDCPTCTAALLARVQPSEPAIGAGGDGDAHLEATQLGRFTLREPLGAGNMGTVFAAWDPQLDRRALRIQISSVRPRRRIACW